MNYSSTEKSLSKARNFQRHEVYKYFITLLIVGSVAVIQYAIYDYIRPAPFLLFYPAVILAALYGDGISAVFLSAFLGQYFFISEGFDWPNDYLRVAIFLVSGFMIRKIIHRETLAKLKAEAVVKLLNEEKISREKFVSTLTHDLQTPLTSAKLQVQLLLRQEGSKETDSHRYEKIHSNINRIESMIRDLLDANLIRAGEKLHLKIDECNINQVIHSTISDLTTQHGDRFKIRENGEIKGYWNCDGIRRIIENICANAIKYGEEGTPVTIMIEPAPDSVLISIHNKGKPIPAEEIPHLFTPYHRVADKAEGKMGWGLGLTLVKGITEAHGGKVKVESSEEKGTIFTIFLPIDARKMIV